MSIGEKIKHLRESHNMTQAEFASVIGVSDKAVSSWEKDASTPRMGVIERISQNFHVTKSYIVDDLDIASVVGPLSGEKELRLLDTFRQLNPVGQDKVLAYADDLLSSGKYIKSDSHHLENQAYA